MKGLVVNYIEMDWKNYPFKKFNKLYLLCDRFKIGGVGLAIIALTGVCQAFTWQFWFRLASCKGIIGVISKFLHRHYSRKWGIYIPRGTAIGGGLIIWHPIGIVINPRAIMGSNCQIHQFLSIGEEKGKYPIIGDNVYIGPNVSIVGGVTIGDNVKIGAGAVVIHDVPANCTTVGNPNRIIQGK